jgi:rhodanese-related sulfurtransferase
MSLVIPIHKQVINELPAQRVREALIKGLEIALVDVREEAPFAEAHPLFAANISYSRIELEAYSRIPRKDTSIVIYDDGEGLANAAANTFIRLGYTNVSLLKGGLQGWRDAGGEIFIDVNSPSKAFGELVESKRHTPSLSANEVQRLINDKADIVILDARRYDEYQTMNIPTSISVPGAELVLHARELTPNPDTLIIVNCAGRTRSIIGTQSIVNAGLSKRVAALRNGTIGWLLAQQKLAHGSQNSFKQVVAGHDREALAASRKVADKAGVKRVTLAGLNQLLYDPTRTTYRFDVRLNEAYQQAHLPGFIRVEGGQLVQETDHYASVRGARIIIYDDNGTRSNMSASWLAQMNWDVYVLDDVNPEQLTENGLPAKDIPNLPELNANDFVDAGQLADLIKSFDVKVIDLATGKTYVNGHIPGALYVLRSQFKEAIAQLPKASTYVLTSPDSLAAAFAFPEFKALSNAKVLLLKGGTDAWINKGFELQKGETHLISPVIDRYKRPYEGTDSPAEAMQAYLDWEYGLVDQLEKDGTHGFYVI